MNAWRLKPAVAEELDSTTKLGAVPPPTQTCHDQDEAHRMVEATGLNALRTATSLMHFRRLLGLPPQFAKPPPLAGMPTYISGRSLAILKQSLQKGSSTYFSADPFAQRAYEFARLRRQRIEALRAEKEATEAAAIASAKAALRTRQQTNQLQASRNKGVVGPLAGRAAPSGRHSGGGAIVARLAQPTNVGASFLDRLQDDHEARARRRAKLEQATLALYDRRLQQATLRHHRKRSAQRRPLSAPPSVAAPVSAPSTIRLQLQLTDS